MSELQIEELARIGYERFYAGREKDNGDGPRPQLWLGATEASRDRWVDMIREVIRELEWSNGGDVRVRAASGRLFK